MPDEPRDAVPDDDPGLVLVDVPAELAVAWVEPGRVTASPPATASPGSSAGGPGPEPVAGPVTAYHGRYGARVAAVHHCSFHGS